LDKWTGKCLISNKDVEYTVYIAPELAHLIQTEQLPQNIQVIQGIPEFTK